MINAVKKALEGSFTLSTKNFTEVSDQEHLKIFSLPITQLEITDAQGLLFEKKKIALSPKEFLVREQGAVVYEKIDDELSGDTLRFEMPLKSFLMGIKKPTGEKPFVLAVYNKNPDNLEIDIDTAIEVL